jgi:repressor LexA
MVTRQAPPGKPDPGHVLTWRQRKILRVIRDSISERGYPPSMREIGDAVGLASIASVSYQLSTLQRKGYLHRDGRRPRTMEVVLPARPAVPQQRTPLPEPVYVPMVSRIAPGVPVLADAQIDDVLPLPRQLVGEGTLFVLTMAGDSMTGAAITDGDWLVVRQRDTAEDGAIVAAMVGGDTTVRRFKRSDGHDWLVPHHPAYLPILADGATILGPVVAVARRLGPKA